MEDKTNGGRIYKLGSDGKVQTAYSVKVIPYSENPDLTQFTMFQTYKNYDVVIENKVIADRPDKPGITREALTKAMDVYLKLYEEDRSSSTEKNKSKTFISLLPIIVNYLFEFLS